jgi:hypothetical protein
MTIIKLVKGVLGFVLSVKSAIPKDMNHFDQDLTI